ncbi:cytochrome C biogenesis protein CcmE [Paenibacillus riograndensis]|uniref:Cytochrome C biogenesis protein CcmE n=1 Tax=Paenibacillus riograndensis TaxID=483937 RepID=A0A132TNK1_9BACL|nr:GntP family permease [Paenibacillus riograndensis]KWX72957.1 cytochrome C biogenesis protein CcmE [Paenibacillus riograndensis]
MEIIGSIGIILGVIAIILFALKEIHITVAAPLATLIVVLLNQMDIVTFMLGSESGNFMGALGNYIVKFFAIFLLGAVLAKFMEESGATISIADFILKKFGTQNPYRVLVAIFIVAVILTYGGISLFVVMFAVIPLARTLFKKLDIAWNLIQIPVWLGIGTVTMTILPGTPAIQNVIPIQFLGTSLVAAAIPSIAGALGCTAFGLFYMKYCLNKSLKAGETYATYADDVEESRAERELPGFFASILPLVTLIIIAVLGSTFGNEFVRKNVIYVALIVAILLAVALFNKHIPDKIRTLSIGASGSIAPIFATASAVAFGSVLMAAPGFEFFSNLITSIPGDPLISLTVLTACISAITGSSSGTLGIVMPNFTDFYLNAGIHPELIHRVAAIASNITTLVPQSGVLLTFLALTKLNHKNGFKEAFITVTVGCVIAVVIVIVLGKFML